MLYTLLRGCCAWQVRFGLANGAAIDYWVGFSYDYLASCYDNVTVADSRWRSFPLRGPLPFSGANAALGYLPLQLALRAEIRILMIRPGKGPFLQQVVFHDLCKQKSRIFRSKHDTKVVPKLQKNANFGTTSLFHIFSK